MTSTSPIDDLPKSALAQDRRHLFWLRRTVRWFLGPDTDTLKQQQLMLIVTAFGFLTLTALFNGLSGVTPQSLVLIHLGALPVLAWLWWFGRWRDRPQQATSLVLLLSSIIIAPATWFLNAGSQGPTLILYLILVSYAIGVQPPGNRWRFFLPVVLLISPIACLLLEARFPDLVMGYADQADRLVDLIFSYIAGTLLMSIVILGHVRRFNQELHIARVLSRRLSDMARKDSLTGLLNHKVIHHGVMAALARHRPFSLIMLDLDLFKKVNDRHGHLYGDTVLVQFALVLRACCEPFSGQVGRAGGEEFLAIIPGPETRGNAFLSQFRTELAASILEHGPVTFSAGVASWNPGDSLNSLIQRADDALYQAKDNGRDCWVVASAAPDAGL
jgi:diguanylate cyclase (GGDEF)-like protein